MKRWEMFRLEECKLYSTVEDKRVRGIYLKSDPSVKRYLYPDVFNFLSGKNYSAGGHYSKKLSDIFKVKTENIKWVGRNIPSKEVNTIPAEDIYTTIDIFKNSRIKTKDGFPERANLLKSEIMKYKNETFEAKTHPDFEAKEIYATNKKKEEKNTDLIVEIVNYLNEKVGTSYKASSGKTKAHINARINEGYTINAFKDVIDSKTKQWKNDKGMSKYLRPETLFGTKFESYFNALKIEPVVEKMPWDDKEEGITVASYREYKTFREKMRSAYKKIQDTTVLQSKQIEFLRKVVYILDDRVEELVADKELKDKQNESLIKMVYDLKEEVETMKNEKKVIKDNMAKKIADFFTTN